MQGISYGQANTGHGQHDELLVDEMGRDPGSERG